MFVLALTDFMAAFYDGIIDGIPPLFGYELSSINNITCAFSEFFSWVTTFVSFYLTVLFTLDKCLAVLFPFSYREFGKPKACIISATILYSVGILFSLPSLIVERKHPTLNKCTPTDFISFITSDLYENQSRFRFVSVLPSIGFVTILLIITIVQIQIKACKKRKRSGAANNPERNRTQSRRDMEITRQMIVVALLFDTLLLSSALCYIRIRYMDISQLGDQALRIILIGVLRNNTALINSTNFYLYIIFGNKFRADFLQLFTSKKPEAGRPNSNAANKKGWQHKRSPAQWSTLLRTIIVIIF